MAGMHGQRVSLGQAKGPDVDLIVDGTELYATYETPEGYPVLYDEALGVFCYARVVDGRYQTTGVPVSEPWPPGVEKHSKESDDVRSKKIEERVRHLNRGSPATPPNEQ